MSWSIIDRPSRFWISKFIVNTPLGQKSRYDEYEIGKSSIRYNVPATTTIAGAQAALRAIRRIKNNKMKYRSLQDIFGDNKKWKIIFLHLLNPLIHLN